MLSSDVDCVGDKDKQIKSKMVGWNPTEYLFEYNLINFQFVPGQGNGKGPKK